MYDARIYFQLAEKLVIKVIYCSINVTPPLSVYDCIRPISVGVSWESVMDIKFANMYQ